MSKEQQELQKDLINTGGSIPLNKLLIKEIGLHEAILYAELVNRFYYFKEKQKLVNGYFYNTVEHLQQATSLSQYQQKKALDNLEKHGLIQCKLGEKKLKFFKIVEDPLILKVILSRAKENIIQKNKKQTKQ